MKKVVKFIIPGLLLMAMLVSGLGLVFSQNTAAVAAAPGDYQNNGSAVCDPDDCPANNGGVCPGGGPNGARGYGNCQGARSASCPCGGRGAR